jgi:hypothetical protein
VNKLPALFVCGELDRLHHLDTKWFNDRFHGSILVAAETVFDTGNYCGLLPLVIILMQLRSLIPMISAIL